MPLFKEEDERQRDTEIIEPLKAAKYVGVWVGGCSGGLVGEIESKRERERERESDRQTDRQTERDGESFCHLIESRT